MSDDKDISLVSLMDRCDYVIVFWQAHQHALSLAAAKTLSDSRS